MIAVYILLGVLATPFVLLFLLSCVLAVAVLCVAVASLIEGRRG